MTAVVFRAPKRHEELVQRLQHADRPTALVGPSGVGKTAIVNLLLDSNPDMVAVQVPGTVDRVERTILELAAVAGDGAEQEVAALLRGDFDDPTSALECLDEALAGRRLLVDDYDALRPGALPLELSELFTSSQSLVSTWVRERATVFTSSTDLPENVDHLEVTVNSQPPWEVVGDPQRTRALWSAARHAPELYRMMLSYWRLVGEAPGPDQIALELGLSEAVWAAAPESVRLVMALLSCYGAAFPAPLFEQLIASIECGEWARDYAQQVLLIERSSRWYWLSPLWRARVPSLLDRPVEQLVHLRLAEFFADISHSKQSPNPRWIQAAHRHFLNAGKLEQAKDYLPFGVGLLLDAGRSASRARQYGLAAEYYDTALQLDQRIRAETGHGIGARARGYARHYYHYNRYEGKQEEIAQTEAGYQRSVEDYPENALFWSRLILARFYQDHWERALATCWSANKSVQSPAARERHLLGRTVTKLLERPRMNEAVVIWGDTTVVSDPRAEEAFARLRRSCAAGWNADLLRVPNLSETVFERPIRVELSQHHGDFRCTLVDVGIAFTASSMLAALRGALEHWIRRPSVTAARLGWPIAR
jgi:hypothetical protein